MEKLTVMDSAENRVWFGEIANGWGPFATCLRRPYPHLQSEPLRGDAGGRAIFFTARQVFRVEQNTCPAGEVGMRGRSSFAVELRVRDAQRQALAEAVAG